MSDENQVNVPGGLEDILLEFTINVLVDKPDDVVDYAASYFTRLKNEKDGGVYSEDLKDDVQDSSVQCNIDEKLSKRGDYYSEELKDDVPDSRIQRNIDEKLGKRGDYYSEELKDDVPDSSDQRNIDEELGNRGDYYSEELKDDGPDSSDQRNIDEELSNRGDYYSEELKDDGPDSNDQRSIKEKLGKRGKTKRPTIIGDKIDPNVGRKSDIEVYPKSEEVREKIKDRTKDIFLFKHLGRKSLEAIIDAMSPTEVKEGDIVIHQGADGDFFYVIEKGCFDASITQDDGQETVVKTYENSGSFGELALLHQQKRAATVTARTDGALWAVSRSTFTKLVVGNAFERWEKHLSLLDSVPELKPLIEYERMQVCDALTSVSLEEGEILFKEGDEGNGMYFIESGTVCIYKESDSGTEVLAELKEGDYFGELALVKKQPRAGTAEAREKTQLAFLDVDAFERLLGPCMDIMKRKMDDYSKSPKK